jgi:hypothetical protein
VGSVSGVGAVGISTGRGRWGAGAAGGVERPPGGRCPQSGAKSAVDMPAVVANTRELFVRLRTHRHEMRKQLGACRGQSASSTGSRRMGASHEDHHEGCCVP